MMSNLPPVIIELHEEKLDTGTPGTTEHPEIKSSSVGVVDVEAKEGAHTRASPRTVHGLSVCFQFTLAALVLVILACLTDESAVVSHDVQHAFNHLLVCS